MTAAAVGLITASFLASAVEVVEAFTIVLAMGLTRGWRSALAGAALALLCLLALTAVAGAALVTLISDSLLQLLIGTLMLIFGLQWLRKAILRSSGLKALHDETVPEAARRADRNPETIRRWIRAGKVRASRVGTQHLVEANDLDHLLGREGDRLPLPVAWQRTASGAPMPDVVVGVRRSRAGRMGT